MPLDCNDVAVDSTFDCSNPWAPDCTSRLGFDLYSIWNITQRINASCPSDPRLFQPNDAATGPALTEAACKHIAGSGMSFYENSIWWTRMTTWKFPLLQLVAQFLRPPLALKTQFFVMNHLLGDPIDTIKNLLFKLARCQERAEDWKLFVERNLTTQRQSRLYGDGGPGSLSRHSGAQSERDRYWKSLSLLTDAYDEWGTGHEAQEILVSLLSQNQSETSEGLLEAITETSDALAADRATKYLPVLVAILFFIFNITVAVTRTRLAIGGETFNKVIFISIEMHSIAFSAIFFWIIPAVLLSSVIGVSQTEERMRRILHRFHNEIRHQYSTSHVDSSLQALISNVGADEDKERVFNGGLYSWQPWYWQSKAMSPDQEPRAGPPEQTSEVQGTDADQEGERDALLLEGQAQPAQEARAVEAPGNRPWYMKILSYLLLLWKIRWHQAGFFPWLIVFLPTFFGMAVSFFVPPIGFNCRVGGEFAIFGAWFLSYELNVFLYRWLPAKSKWLFWGIYFKDLASTLGTIIFTFYTIVGCFNRCSCWMDSDSKLILPQRPDNDQTLRDGLRRDYPAYIFSAIAIELIVIPLGIIFYYYDALRVFVQRDDGKPNWEWFQSKVHSLRRHSQITSRPTMDIVREDGRQGQESHEMQDMANSQSEDGKADSNRSLESIQEVREGSE